MKMRYKMLLLAVLAASAGSIVLAEPVSVDISGNTRIRGNYFNMDSRGDARFIQQNTRISINVDFTSEMSAVVDLETHTDRMRYNRRPASRLHRISRNR